MQRKKEDLAREVRADFDARREARKRIEAQWLLNVNFMLGNQYSVLDSRGELTETDKRYFWQEREVYNHIAPLIETRLAKFARVNCAVTVRPSSNDDADVNTARLSTKIIEATQQDNGFVKLFGDANYWAELTGTAFYKVIWDESERADGSIAGGVRIAVCPPYEIYPDSLSAQDMDACRSIIHAKAYPVAVIRDLWGTEVEAEDVSVLNSDVDGESLKHGYGARVSKEIKSDHAIVIERYELPDSVRKNGRLVIVAGNKVLYDGELPYVNAAEGKRGYPFVRQVALEQPASFYGRSIIERLIPVQRAYNAVKNRKHEFMNRLSAGVLAVEEGSVDTEQLEEEGLAPGKVVIYRQGSNPPVVMSAGTVPGEFRDEEDRLLSEFQSISGISNLLNVSGATLSAISGYALSLLLEQDYSRLSVTTESIRAAVKEVCRKILRLYKQFVDSERLIRISGDNGEVEVVAFRGSGLTSEDIVMESNSEMVETPATRKNMVLELLKYGLLSDENGKISNRNRAKIVEMLGFGNWEAAKSREEMHVRKAEIENLDMSEGKKCEVEAVDDHELHVEEHTSCLVSGRDTLSDKSKKLINEHIRRHKVIARLALAADAQSASLNSEEKE